MTNPAQTPSTRALALFDLDNTLLAGDSDYLWGKFLVDEGWVDGESYERENQRFYDEYKAGVLDIHEFLRFSLKPLTEHDPIALTQQRARFVTDYIAPIVAPHSRALLQQHRDRGDEIVIITATNRFVTEPIATLLGVSHLLATDPEIIDGRYTGRIAGIPCFQQGKIQRLEQWLASRQETFGERWFYSDSRNDLPLLEQVDHPVVVDGDTTLSAIAAERGWPQISLRHETMRHPTPRLT